MTPATFIPLWSSLGLRRRRWSVAAWLAVPLGILLLAVAIKLPLALHSSGVLDRVPVARASSGVDGLAGAPDPVTEPAASASFVSQRLDAYWRSAFAAMGRAYVSPGLRLFDEGISIPCFPLMAFEDGAPFYCFLDDTIYLPVPYISDLARATGAGGRMIVGYVLAHEYAHHLQHLTGLGATVEQQRAPQGAPMRRASVHYELQADCLAGVWASSVSPPGALDRSTMGRAEDTAALIRDPRGTSSDSHGSLVQRQSAFWSGYTSGRASRCESW